MTERRYIATMPKALVIVHLSTIDSYAWTIGEEKATQLADRIIRAVRKHRGPVYIIDQFWDGPLRDRIAAEISAVPAQWIEFDEDVGDWKRFLPSLKRRLTRDHVTSVVIGGVWFDPKLKEGCATEVYLYLLSTIPTKVDKTLVGCETDS
jgi:hypothetical protein